MHNAQTVIVSSEIIGVAADGTTLNRWTESDGRMFEESYDYVKAVSGTLYGVTTVRELSIDSKGVK